MINVYRILLLLGVISSATCYIGDDNPTPVDNILDNKDEKADIKEPCKDSKDMDECVRDFFKDHGRCDVVRNWNDKPFRLMGKHKYNAPSVNTSFECVNSIMKNLHGVIETFFVNVNTGNLVIAVRFTDFSYESNKGRIVIYQKGKEPMVLVKRLYNAYPDFTITAVIPAGKNIINDDMKNRITNYNLHDSLYSTYYPQKNTVLDIGPDFFDNQNPVVSAVAKGIKDDLPQIIEEFLVNGAPTIFLLYLQKFICNFGILYPLN